MLASAGNGILRSCRLTPRPKPKPFVPRPFLQITTKSKSTPVTPRMSSNFDPTPTPAADRLISVVSYTLPFFNSLHYGRYLFLQFPNLGLLFDPILPLVALYRSIPYSSFVAFFALYLGVVRNPSFSRYVRFNSMQAVTLDVLLVLPLLLQRIFTPGRTGLGLRLMVWAHNVLFLFTLVCFLYSVASCVLGRTPHLPFVADAASRQI
ncbi:protein TIC 20-II, chloroplastic [Neltuma alba]|uniref:protein TIC 20-II, chloroplastic n=1 Tax=Neltuma alba TaxID=207710 RepID=UPI0010A5245B|nr:protein TIC 20-II, chloroplastic [Prosopis alba]